MLIGQITRPEDDKPLERASVIVAWTDLPTYRDITNLFMSQTGRLATSSQTVG